MAIIVNGERIEDSIIHQEVERLRPRYEQIFFDMEPDERDKQLHDWSKENVIERIILRQHVKKDGPQIDPQEVEKVLESLKEQYEKPEQFYKDLDVKDDETAKKAIELQLKVERKINEIAQVVPKPTQKQIEEYYNENKESFKTPEQIRVAHIVKYINWQTDEMTALEVITQAKEEIDNGSAFEMVVDKYNDCTDKGGDLGFIMKGQMVEEFDDIVFNLNVGQVSDVFRTRFGFHIAKVYQRVPPAIPPLNRLKKQIIEICTQQMQETAVEMYLDELKSRAKIIHL